MVIINFIFKNREIKVRNPGSAADRIGKKVINCIQVGIFIENMLDSDLQGKNGFGVRPNIKPLFFQLCDLICS